MIRSNFHTHYSICDGHGSAEEYVEAAIAKGFTSLGFSSHAPMPIPSEWTMQAKDLPRYISDIQALKEKYSGVLEIYQGWEFDFPDYVAGLDFTPEYTIGSIHQLYAPSLDRWLSIDNTREEVEELMHTTFDGSFVKLSEAYFQAVSTMIEKSRPDIVGHLDLLKKLLKNRPFFNENDPLYRKQIYAVLDVIKDTGNRVEINTGAMSRKILNEPYPSLWILKECRERKIPLVINSDCHRPEWIDFGFDTAEELAREAGYTSHQALSGGRWRETAL